MAAIFFKSVKDTQNRQNINKNSCKTGKYTGKSFKKSFMVEQILTCYFTINVFFSGPIPFIVRLFH